MRTTRSLTLHRLCGKLHTLYKEVLCIWPVTSQTAQKALQRGWTAPCFATQNAVGCVLLEHKAITCTLYHELLALISSKEDPVRLATQHVDFTS